MFNSENGYSLADIAAATGNGGNGNGWFDGNGGWWIILLFLFALGGWGNNGNGFGGGNGGSTAAALYGIDNMSEMSTAMANGFYNINTGLLNGFAGTTAAVNAGTSAIQSDICNMGMQNLQNTNAITQAINADTIANMQNTFGISQQLASMQSAQQLANCQTDQNIANSFAQLNYNLATEACADRAAITTGARDIIDNANANTRQILDFLVQDRITALTSENQALKGQISQSEQNAYLLSHLQPNPTPAYLVANPYTGGYGYGWNGFYGAANIVG